MELLVVLTLMALVMALLAPAMDGAIEAGCRAVCAAQIHGQLAAGITYATTARGRLFPDLHNATGAYNDNGAQLPWWFSRTQRDWLRRSYGVSRKSLYCPSNAYWNNDGYWNEDGKSPFTGTGSVVLGYAYFGNDRWLATEPTWVTWVPTPRTNPVVPMGLTDSSEFDVLWADLSRTQNGQFLGGGNHIDPNARESPPPQMPKGPGGANTGWRDGHVSWNDQDHMVRRFWAISGATYRFFW